MAEFFIGLGLAMILFVCYWWVDSVYSTRITRWIREKMK